MNHFDYRDGLLHAEDVSLTAIAARVGTPFYCYSSATLTRHYEVLRAALADLPVTICYAVKANSNGAVLSTLAGLGGGADVVSGGELKRALAAGIPGDRIVFSGVGKTAEELAQALTAGVMQINVESEAELDMLDSVAAALGTTAPVALRVNPDVSADTHDKISTGRKEDKFGIDWSQAHRVYRHAAGLSHVSVVGAAVHIGSQVSELTPFRTAFRRMRDLVAMLKRDGITLQRLDLGGGLAVPYTEALTPAPEEYAAVVRETVGDLGLDLVVEPGRLLVANAGVLVTRVIRLKEGATRTFVVVDAAMNDLMRPALYDAWHQIRPVRAPGPEVPAVEDPDDPTHETLPWRVDVVGPVCESGDTFARQVTLPPVGENDLLVLCTAGAYGATMAGTYNSRPLIPEVMVHGDQWAVVRRRQTLEELMAAEEIPPWLGETP